MKKLSIMLDVSIPNVGIELENITICPGIASVTVPSSMERMFGIHHYQNPLDPASRLELTLDDKFTIQSGKKTRSLPFTRYRPRLHRHTSNGDNGTMVIFGCSFPTE